jgi:hypothetical protein
LISHGLPPWANKWPYRASRNWIFRLGAASTAVRRASCPARTSRRRSRPGCSGCLLLEVTAEAGVRVGGA